MTKHTIIMERVVTAIVEVEVAEGENPFTIARDNVIFKPRVLGSNQIDRVVDYQVDVGLMGDIEKLDNVPGRMVPFRAEKTERAE